VTAVLSGPRKQASSLMASATRILLAVSIVTIVTVTVLTRLGDDLVMLKCK
jgi:hypothetical protein